MDSSTFLNIKDLSEEAKEELKMFYEFLLFKSRKMKSGNKNSKRRRFEDFLSTPINLKDFNMLNREERNER